MLQPIDVFVALKLVVSGPGVTYAALAGDLGLSTSQVHRAVRKCEESGLVGSGTLKPNVPALLEFSVHGLRYVYPARPGALTRGVPTAHSAPPLSDEIAASGTVFVWPDPNGALRGEAIEPLCRQVPFAAMRDRRLYELLTLVDALRVGRAREREIAARFLRDRLHAESS